MLNKARKNGKFFDFFFGLLEKSLSIFHQMSVVAPCLKSTSKNIVFDGVFLK
jgi:hypothetical protein